MSASTPETSAEEPQPHELNAGPSLRELFVAFFCLGATAFGGPAMVAYIRHMAVEQKGWLSPRSFDDGVALCQALPGATAMQTAAYVGLSVRGVAGAAVSFVGFGLPALSLMMVLSALYVRAHNLPVVVSTFSGLQAIVVAIIANAAVSFGRTTLKHWRHVPITAVAAALFGWRVSPFLVLGLAALLGFCLLKVKISLAPSVTPSEPMLPTTRSVMLILGAVLVLLAAGFHFHRRLYELAMMMLRIDLFAFGGGFASVPLLFNEVVTVRHWLDGPTLVDGIVLGQVTPGPVVITATFVGYLSTGFWGALIATLAVFLPSFLLVIAAAPYFDRLRTAPVLARFIGGALCAFPALLLIVAFDWAQNICWDLWHLVLAVAAFAALRLGTNILWVVLAGTGLALLCFR